MYEDNITLQIYRTYSKDEAIGFLKQTITKKDFEIGTLHSTVAEITDDKIKLAGELVESRKRARNLKTQLDLIRRYFKVKFDRTCGLHIIEKQKQLL